MSLSYQTFLSIVKVESQQNIYCSLRRANILIRVSALDLLIFATDPRGCDSSVRTHNVFIHPLMMFLPAEKANQLHDWNANWAFSLNRYDEIKLESGK